MKTFDEQITDFNKLYKLPTSDVPIIPFSGPKELVTRLQDFQAILAEELKEGQVIELEATKRSELEILAEIADWLGDIIVYCASEMRKFGIPFDLTLSTIMASNMSKLGSDGKPIYDDRGKVMKGPDYWPPEPQLKRMLAALIRQYQQEQTPAQGETK